MEISELKLYKNFGSKRIDELAGRLVGSEEIESFFNYQDGKAFDAYSNGDYEKYLVRAAKAKDELLSRLNGADHQPVQEPDLPAKEETGAHGETEPDPDPTITAEYVGREEHEAPATDAGNTPLYVMVASLIKKQATLFHDSEEAGYLRYKHKGHVETHPVDSMGFRRYAMYLAFTHFNQAIGRESMTSLTGLLNAEAVFSGERRKVERRVAHRAGTYYIDICDPEWHVIEVTPGQGWTILHSKQSPVCFIRSRNAQALPMPERGAGIDTVWDYVNVPEADRLRVLTWVLECYRPQTQFPILSLKAVAGSGKTETENTLRLLTDPNKALTSRSPNSTRDVLSNASNNHVVAFDNMSRISDSLSDLLCCMATGSGHRERKYFTNLEEEVIQLKRPVMFDGIEFLARRDDLIDRLIHVELPPLRDRVSEYDFTAQRKEDLPFLFGALLGLLVDATGRVESVKDTQGVRMMDYAKLGQAVCDSLGNGADFTAELRDHQAVLKHRILDDSPFLMLLLEILDKSSGADNWVGTPVSQCADGSMRFRQYPGKLLASMTSRARFKGIGTSNWPMKPNGVISLFDRHKVALTNLGLTHRKVGIDSRGTLHEFIFNPKSKKKNKWSAAGES